MAYIAPIHRPTSVRNALRLRLLPGDEDSLAISISNRLEIWRVTPEGMHCVHRKLINGTIASLARLRPVESETDIMFFSTDHFQYFTASWDPDTNQLRTESAFEDDSEPSMRASQSRSKCIVDPDGRFLALHLWEGIMNVFCLPRRRANRSQLQHVDQVRISELWLRDSTFVPTETREPQVAFLYQIHPHKAEAHLAIYALAGGEKLSQAGGFNPRRDRMFDVLIPDPTANILIPVPIVEGETKRYHRRNTQGGSAQLGGLLVLGQGLLLYIDGLTYKTVNTVLPESILFRQWAERDPTRYFVSDELGGLHLLTIQHEEAKVTGLTITPFLFRCASRAHSLVYMGNDLLFIASLSGNSQLWRVDVSSSPQLGQMVHEMPSNAPMLDFVVMDMANRDGGPAQASTFASGQTRLVASCGAWEDGGLRSIRSGIGIEEIGVLGADTEDVKGIFSIVSAGGNVEVLVVALLMDTRVFCFGDDGDIEEVPDFRGMELGTRTLLASTVGNGHLLQVTKGEVRLLDDRGGVSVSSWRPPAGKEITNCSANSKWLLVSIEGTLLVVLDLLHNLAAMEQAISAADEIACVHAGQCPEDIGAVGFWKSGTISLIGLPTLQPLIEEAFRQTTDSASVPRDIALVQLLPPSSSGPTLLVALEDGDVVVFVVSAPPQPLALSDRRHVMLGSKQAKFHLLPSTDGTCNVFATTEHPSLIHSQEGRIVFSAADAGDASHVASLDTLAFPGALVHAGSDNRLRIARIDNLRRAHVTTLPLQETVRRIAYSPSLRAFALGRIRREIVRNEEMMVSTISLVDEVIFKPVGQTVVVDACPGGSELIQALAVAALPDPNGEPADRFLLGTAYVDSHNSRQIREHRGRILVFGVGEDRSMHVIVSRALKGDCRALAAMEGGRIVGVVGRSIVVYAYSQTTSAHAKLVPIAHFAPSAFPTDVTVTPGSLQMAVMDIAQSVMILEFMPRTAGREAKLVERARHLPRVEGVAICYLETDRWLLADMRSNLTVLERKKEGMAEDRKRLVTTSEINLGEQVAKIRRLDVEPVEEAVVNPQAFISTIEGSMYLFGTIAPRYRSLLFGLQERLSTYVETPGGIDHATWRAYRDQVRETTAPTRFVDGEYAERFLDLDQAAQEMVCDGLGHTAEATRSIVEALRQMR